MSEVERRASATVADDRSGVPLSVAWVVLAVVLLGLWLCVMGLWQQGFEGLVKAGAASFAACSCLMVFVDIRYGLGKFIVPMRVLGIAIAVCLWLVVVGSYSLPLDLLSLFCGCAAAFLLVYRGSERRDRWARLHGRLVTLRWGDPRYALLTGPARWRFRLFAFVWLLVSWSLSSLFDVIFAPRAVITTPTTRTRVVREAWRELRVGVALSGGGYRAALMHAGILRALEDLGVPVTHLSCVSGGAIVGAFYAAGGEPAAFLRGVEERRFNLTRDMFDIHNAARMVLLPGRIPLLGVELLPFASFSRTDVQAAMLDRALLNGIGFGELAAEGPELMICCTDLRRAVALGFVRNGVIVSSLTPQRDCRLPRTRLEPAFLPTGSDQFPGTESLARVVAASGAFPLAFNSVVAAVPTGTSVKPAAEPVQLADGGVFDNTGLRLMLDAHRAHRKRDERALLEMEQRARQRLQVAAQEARVSQDIDTSTLGPSWRLDLVLVSDGGELLEEKSEIRGLGELVRAIDVMYACAGSRFFMVEALQRRGRPTVLVLGNAPFAQHPAGWKKLEAVGAAIARVVEAYGETESLNQAAAQIWRPPESPPEPTTPPDPLADALQRAVHGMPDECRQVLRSWRAGGRLPGLAATPDPAAGQSVLEDLETCVRTFRGASTLKDRFSTRDARALYRLGQYLVLLNWGQIRRSLDRLGRT